MAMLISHKYKFIFVKTMKTAGSSVQEAFAKAADAEVVVPPLRRAISTKHLDRQFEGLGTHATLRRVYTKLGQDILPYKIVSIERNPFDKLVSAYFYGASRHDKLDGVNDIPADFAAKLGNGNFDSVMSPKYFTANNQVLADHVIRFEHIYIDFAEVIAALGLPEGAKIRTTRKNQSRPQEYRGTEGVARMFDGALVDVVRARYPHYFEVYGYGGIGSDCPAIAPSKRRAAIKARWVGKANRGTQMIETVRTAAAPPPKRWFRFWV